MICVAIMLAASVVSVRPSVAAGDPAVKPGTTAQSSPLSTVPTHIRNKMLAQRPYSEGAKQIQAAILRSGAAGYAGIGISDTAVQLWWKGPIPAQIQTVIDSVRASVAVDIKPAPHSRQELKAEAARVFQAVQADRSSAVHSVQIPVDGTRVIAAVDPSSSKSIVDPARSALWTSRTRTGHSVSLVGASGITVEVVEKPRQSVACGPPARWNDGWAGNSCTPATFSGGGAITNPEVPNSGCTAGFGVSDGWRTFILTAGHCGRSGGPMNNGSNNRQLGYGFAEHVAHDLLLIEAPADNWMWDGNSTWNNFTKNVVGWDWARSGEMVCFSGAQTGAFCELHNTSNFTFGVCDHDVYGNYECYNDLIVAENSPHLPYLNPCRDGDSGAPVFTLSGSYSVIAKGTLTSCGFGGLSYQDFGTAYQDFGIYPLT